MFGCARMAGWCPFMPNCANLGMGSWDAAKVALLSNELDLRVIILTAFLNRHSSSCSVGCLATCSGICVSLFLFFCRNACHLVTALFPPCCVCLNACAVPSLVCLVSCPCIWKIISNSSHVIVIGCPSSATLHKAVWMNRTMSSRYCWFSVPRWVWCILATSIRHVGAVVPYGNGPPSCTASLWCGGIQPVVFFSSSCNLLFFH